MSRPSSLVVAALVAVVAVIVTTMTLLRARESARPATRTASLGNGLVVDVARVDGVDRVAAAVLFRVGDDHDPPGRSGLANVLRRVVRARLERTTTAAHVDVDGDGAFSVMSMTGAAADVDSTLRALGALLVAPGLDDGVVDVARAAALDEVARRRGADPMLAARSWALESVAPSRGGGWRGGIADELAAVTRADVEGFWRATFGGDHATVTVAGDVDVDETIVAVERALGALPRSTGASLRAAATTFVHGTLVMGDQPRAVAFATPGPAPGAPSFAPFIMLASRLESAATAAKFNVDFNPARAAHLVVATSLGDGETADAGAARLRTAIVEIVQRPFAASEIDSTKARYAVFLGDDVGCARDLQGCAVARARRGQLGVTNDALVADLDATGALDSAAVWFDERHASIAAAGGVLR